jgi:hypothetical protein
MPTVFAADCSSSSAHDGAVAAVVGPVDTGGAPVGDGAGRVWVIVWNSVDVVGAGPEPLDVHAASTVADATSAAARGRSTQRKYLLNIWED